MTLRKLVSFQVLSPLHPQVRIKTDFTVEISPSICCSGRVPADDENESDWLGFLSMEILCIMSLAVALRGGQRCFVWAMPNDIGTFDYVTISLFLR
jgi:hypothetical protein